MVVVCGHNMGDIFRRNAFNLGLHVVQSPEAVADAQDGDEFTLRSRSRAQLRNVTQGKTYEPGAAVAEGRRDPPRAAASSRSAAASSAVGRDRAVDRLARRRAARGG